MHSCHGGQRDRQGRGARYSQLNRGGNRSHHHRQPAPGQAGDERRAPAVSHEFQKALVDKVAGERGENPHVEDVPPQCQQPAILKQQRLGSDHGRHDQRGGPGTQHDRRQRAAQHVARGAAGNRKVEHLGRKDKGGQDAHERNLPLAQLPPGLAQRPADQNGRQQPPKNRYRGTEETIRNVQHDGTKDR